MQFSLKSETENEVSQSCPTLCDLTDCNLPGSSIRGIFQARILEWVAISFSRGFSKTRDWTWVSRIVDRCFTIWATKEVNVPLVSLIFLKISLDFPIILFSSISWHWLLRKAFLSLLASLWNSAFKWVYLSFPPLPFTSLLFTGICKASLDNHFGFFCISFFGEWSWSLSLYNVMNLHP